MATASPRAPGPAGFPTSPASTASFVRTCRASARRPSRPAMAGARPSSPLTSAASSARVGMELEERLARIIAPTLIVTTQESGLQSVEAVERSARRIPHSQVIVLPGDSYHIAAVEPELCAQHALRFMQEASGRE